MGKFCHFLTELSARDRSVFSFPDDNFSKCQWMFTKLGVCIHIVNSALGLQKGKFRQFFDRVICLGHVRIFISGRYFTKYQWIFTKLWVCIDFVDIWFGIANGRISSIF